MAVITRYIVVRNGVELDQVFTDKKEAEAYDKMLDAAENLARFIKDAGLDIRIDDQTIDAISVHLAKNAPEVTAILKSVKPMSSSQKTAGKESDEPSTTAEDKKKAQESKVKTPRRGTER